MLRPPATYLAPPAIPQSMLRPPATWLHVEIPLHKFCTSICCMHLMTPDICNWCNVKNTTCILFCFVVLAFSSPAEDVLLPGAWYPLSATFLREWRGYWTSTVSTSLFCSSRVKVIITLVNFWSFWRLANTPSLMDRTSTVVASVKMMPTALCKWTRSCRSWGRHQLIGPPSNWHQIRAVLHVMFYVNAM